LARWLLSGWAALGRSVLGLAVLITLVPLGLANMYVRATSADLEDGVLWASRPEGVVVAEDVTPGGPGALAGIRRGDVLQAIDGQPVERAAEVGGRLAGSAPGTTRTYALTRQGVDSLVEVAIVSVPRGRTALYWVLAPVGLFSLLVGAGVRLSRPGAPVSLHFLWLTVAFFATFTFSFTSRLDRLDYFFYWADVVGTLLLSPLFLHFTLVFPDRPRVWASAAIGRFVVPLLYLPAALLGLTRAVALARAAADAPFYVGVIGAIDRLELLHLSLYFAAGLAVLLRAFRQVRSLTARRQLRWVVWGTLIGATPFAAAYALPFSLGARTSLAMDLSAIPLGLIPLAYASAIVRYRLRDVEVIVKRLLVWSTAVTAIAVIYTVLWRAAAAIFLQDSHNLNAVVAVLATLVVVLLARPVTNGIQAAIDRAFYRDRYDYRRALVGFARDLSTELDLARLAERLIARVTETLLVDRMALLLVDDRTGGFVSYRTEGLPGPVPRLAPGSRLTARLTAGAPVALDDPLAAHGLDRAEIEAWFEQEIYHFVPCLSKEGAIAVLALGRKRNGEALSSEDTGLLAAVAGQVATSFENGRLYHRLRQTAQEMDRLRGFGDSIIESLDVGLLVVDPDDVIIRWNRAVEQLVGRPREEAVGRRLDDVFDPGFVRALRASRHAEPDATTLFRMPLPVTVDGQAERLLVNATAVPLQALDAAPGVPSGSIIILEDVTDRVHLEEQLQISEKMASIGLLAAGVAHEVNTPLTGISSYTQMLLEGADQSDPRTTLLQKIERQTFRAARIVNGLLSLSRPSTGSERAPVDVNTLVNDVLSLLEHQFKVGSIQVRRDLASPGPVVMGVEFKLQQVFLNLFLNALDAMPKGGWLSVLTRVERGKAVIEVSDTGAGIQPEHLSRIYDPFFTTKAIGRGTGLGLSITYGIVREHEGTIGCESEVGLGTRFTLSFPPALAIKRSSRVAN